MVITAVSPLANPVSVQVNVPVCAPTGQVATAAREGTSVTLVVVNAPAGTLGKLLVTVTLGASSAPVLVMVYWYVNVESVCRTKSPAPEASLAAVIALTAILAAGFTFVRMELVAGVLPTPGGSAQATPP